jgi:hypothetical protein
MHPQDKDAARYRQLRKMLLQERLARFFASHPWPTGSDKRVSDADFDAAIDAAIEAEREQYA